MDGFRVDTSLLDDTVPQYSSVATNLAYQLGELRQAAALLRGQTPAKAALAQLEAAIAELGACIEQTRELSCKTREISECYQEHERKAAKIVAALPSSPAFGEALPLDPAPGISTNIVLLRIMTVYVSEPAPLIRGSRLPCEDWLFERLIKDEWMI